MKYERILRSRFLNIFAVITSFGAYVIVLMGVLVTETGSGQGCGTSWPLCHGQLIPDSVSVQGAIEYSHRIAAGFDGFLIGILMLWSWLAYRHDFRVKLLGILSFLFVVVQGALGALTVMYEGTFELRYILAVHFGLALISFASVMLLTLYLFQISSEKRQHLDELAAQKPASRNLQYSAWGLAVLTYIVVYTGALVRHAGATLGCGTEWPLCNGNFTLSFTEAAGVQILHRLSAGSIWFLILAFLIVILLRYKSRPDIVSASWWAFILVTLQAASGALTVITGGQLVAALIHTTIISALFAVLCYLCMQAGWPWKRQKTVEVRVLADKNLKTVGSSR
jgi:heme a synthase